MKSLLKTILVFGVVLIVWSLLSACRGGLNKNIDSIQEKLEHKIPVENIFVSPDFDKDKPLSVAILPFENLTREKEASDLLQRLFYNNFSSLAYRDVELGAIFTISDSLAELEWKPKFHLKKTRKGLELLYKIAIDCLEK